MDKYYKVVVNGLVCPDMFTSAVMHDPRYCVFYKLNEWARPVIGKLFVYTSLAAAELFCTKISRKVKYRLFECECENPVRPGFTNVVDISVYNYHELLNHVLEGFWKHSYTYSRWTLPKDTMICDAVKLIKEIPLK